jgi:hypothetical protein
MTADPATHRAIPGKGQSRKNAGVRKTPNSFSSSTHRASDEAGRPGEEQVVVAPTFRLTFRKLRPTVGKSYRSVQSTRPTWQLTIENAFLTLVSFAVPRLLSTYCVEELARTAREVGRSASVSD